MVKTRLCKQLCKHYWGLKYAPTKQPQDTVYKFGHGCSIVAIPVRDSGLPQFYFLIFVHNITQVVPILLHLLIFKLNWFQFSSTF